MYNSTTLSNIDLIDNREHMPGLFGKFIQRYISFEEWTETSKYMEQTHLV